MFSMTAFLIIKIKKQLTEHAFYAIISIYLQGRGNIMYSALEIAKYIIDKCTKDRCPVSNLQLQKILYYVQREFLSLKIGNHIL